MSKIIPSASQIPWPDAVSLGQYPGMIPGRKFGTSPLMATTDSDDQDIWLVGSANGLKVNRIDIDIDTPVAIYYTSTDDTDTVEMVVFATILNTDLGIKENVALTHDLNGQTPTLLTYTDPDTGTVYNTFSRVFRAANNNGTALAGSVYYSTGPVENFTAGVPDSTDQIQAYVHVTEQQTLMTHVFIPDNYWAILKVVAPKILNEGSTTATNGDLRLKIKSCGKTYLTKDVFPVSSSSGTSPYVFGASEPLAPCTDVKFVVTGGSVGRASTRFSVTYWFELFRTDRISMDMFGVFS